MIKIEFKSEFKQFDIEYNDNELSIIEANLRLINSNINNSINTTLLSDKIQTEYTNRILKLKNVIDDSIDFNVSGLILISTNRKIKHVLTDTNYKEVLKNVLSKLTDSKGLISLCKNYIKYDFNITDENINQFELTINQGLDNLSEFVKESANLNINQFEFSLYDMNKPDSLKIDNDLYELNKFIAKFNIVDKDDKTLSKIEHSSNNLNIYFKLSYYDYENKYINTLICKLHKLDSIIKLQSLITKYYNIIKDNNILTPKETRGRKEGMLVGIKYKKHKTKD